MPRPRETPRLAVGDIWVVHHPHYPDRYWHFRLIWACTWQGQRYVVGLKEDIAPDSQQVLVFDAQGRTMDAEHYVYEFVCTRRSRRKAG